jgi:hypothetical protein
MFNKNVPAKFQTEHDSTYTVDPTGVTRDKPADPNRKTVRQEKNIYYLLDPADGEKVLKHLDQGWKHKCVLALIEDTFQLVLSKGEKEGMLYFEMTNKPALGLSPVDMFMESNGMISANSRFHVGHEIVKML